MVLAVLFSDSSMKRLSKSLLVLLLASASSTAQQSSADPAQLAERLPGHWLLQGAIGGKQTTHDVDAEWVLNHEYVRLHEVSREKKADGQPAYEAIIFIAWDGAKKDYVCMWLDNTEGGGLSAQGLARGMAENDAIHFIFHAGGPNEQFHNVFEYHRGSDTWEWRLDDDEASCRPLETLHKFTAAGSFLWHPSSPQGTLHATCSHPAHCNTCRVCARHGPRAEC
jgi:hypothetical protein